MPTSIEIYPRSDFALYVMNASLRLPSAIISWSCSCRKSHTCFSSSSIERLGIFALIGGLRDKYFVNQGMILLVSLQRYFTDCFRSPLRFGTDQVCCKLCFYWSSFDCWTHLVRCYCLYCFVRSCGHVLLVLSWLCYIILCYASPCNTTTVEFLYKHVTKVYNWDRHTVVLRRQYQTWHHSSNGTRYVRQ